jgi:hypothetical protein
MYKLMKPKNGVLTVIVVEYDEVSDDAIRIPKGTNGYGSGTEDPEGLRYIKEKKSQYKPKQNKLL